MSTIQTFDFSVDILRSLLWRNNEAVNLEALMQFKQDYIDTNNEAFWTDWLVNVFDLRTADIFGLNVWSIILDLNITIIASETTTPNSNFGFGEFRKNFNNGNFTEVGSDISLSEDDARLLLRLRYHQLTTNGNVSGINVILEDLFGDSGVSFVEDNLDMTMQYVFEFSLDAGLQSLLTEFDVLPRPTGVESNLAVQVANANFGFGASRKNFNNGNFTAVG